jgi:hypothetical protein
MAMIFVLLVGVIAGLGMGACMVAIAVEARHVPNRPFHMRFNPLNILADRSLWTPQICALHRIALRLGLVFVACVVLVALVSLLRWP